MKNTLSHLYLGAIFEVLQHFDVPSESCAAFLNLPKNWDLKPLQRLPMADLVRLLDHLAVTHGEPNIGLKVGNQFRISTYAKTGSIYGFCKNLYQVIEMNAAYQQLAIDLGQIAHGQEGDRHQARLYPYNGDHTQYRQVIDLIMGACGTAYRWLIWASGEDLAGMVFPYRAPADKQTYEDLLQCPVVFDPSSKFCALEFTQKAMDQDLPTYDTEKLALGRAKLDELLKTDTARASLDAALKAAIRGSIKAGSVTTETISQRMGLSWSKIRSKLSDPELSFRDRTDTVRIEMFYEYYKEGLSFAEISQALAFNDQPAFNRAFKRWFDTSPKKWVEERGGG